jgi:ribosome maturation factor RimP
MVMESQVKVIEQKVIDLISAEPDLFLVEVRIKPTNNIKVFIDGDNGVSIDKLVHYNRRLYRQLEEEQMYPNGDFSLEVSSPGLDEPLKLGRQYQKNVGRYVEVTETDGTRKEGKLIGVNEQEIVIEEEKGKNKKKEIINHTLLLERIKSTKIQIKF